MRFVVHKHVARTLHYDFRLELGGVLKSWAMRYPPPSGIGVKRLMVPVEDHPLTYIDFEGVIPSGYGAGTVQIWDRGRFYPWLESPKSLGFDLDGSILDGVYRMVKMSTGNWLIWRLK